MSLRFYPRIRGLAILEVKYVLPNNPDILYKLIEIKSKKAKLTPQLETQNDS